MGSTIQANIHSMTALNDSQHLKGWWGHHDAVPFLRAQPHLIPTTMRSNDMTQCGLLIAAGLQEQVLLPGSEAHTRRQASYWAANVALQPSCIVQPRTTADVSQTIKVLAKADGAVALRSGGHTQWTGSNDVREGVTIDLGRMVDVDYDAQSGLASVQPGPKWADVYQKLLSHGVCVTGGREGNVGVADFLTGGGNSYFAGLHGLGCDNVANFEGVLASGEVVNANATSHSDLWMALKGASGNFGIVTKFDMYTFPACNLWGGIRAAEGNQGDRLAELAVEFTDNKHRNPETAFILNYIYNPVSSGTWSSASSTYLTRVVKSGSPSPSKTMTRLSRRLV